MVASAAVAGGRVYVGSDNGFMYCLNQTTGGIIWAFQTGLCVFMVIFGVCDGVSIVRSSPAVFADLSVVFGSYDTYIYRVR